MSNQLTPEQVCEFAEWIADNKYRRSTTDNLWWKIGNPEQRYTTKELLVEFLTD
jgi:hypothetical protein